MKHHRIGIAAIVLLLVTAGCTGAADDGRSTTPPTATSSSTGAPTTVAATTTTVPAGDPPPAVTGLTVEVAEDGSGILIAWDHIADAGIVDYFIWYSELPGESKRLAAQYSYDPGDDVDGRLMWIHQDRVLEDGHNCYQVSAAADTVDNEGESSIEVCVSVP
jgi:hypothetical protein